MHDYSFLASKLSDVETAFKSENSFKLRSISNTLIKKAALENDQFVAKIVLISYALHKLLTKEHIVNSEHWFDARKNLLHSLTVSISFLKKEDGKSFRKSLQIISNSVAKIDSQAGHFFQSTFDKAKIKYGSTAYFYGMSLSQAAFLTGADRSSLQSYIGVTKQHEDADVVGIEKRLSNLKSVLCE